MLTDLYIHEYEPYFNFSVFDKLECFVMLSCNWLRQSTGAKRTGLQLSGSAREDNICLHLNLELTEYDQIINTPTAILCYFN